MAERGIRIPVEGVKYKAGLEVADFNFVLNLLKRERLSEITPREQAVLLEASWCLNCTECLGVCPVLDVIPNDKWPGPRNIVSELSRSVTEYYLSNDVVYNCTLCGACEEACPKNIPVPKLTALLRTKILDQRPDLVPVEYKEALDRIRKFNLVFEPMPKQEKIESAKGRMENLRLPWIPDRVVSRAKVVYFPGCQAEERYIEIREATKLILEKLKVNYTLFKDMSCCGLPAELAGDCDLATQLQDKLAAQIEKIGADTVVTTCAGCTAELKKVMEAKGVKFEVKHLIEYLAEDYKLSNLVNALKRVKSTPLTVSLHKSCDLSRKDVGNYIMDYTEDILKVLPNTKFKSLGDPDRCCGAGGLVSYSNPGLANAILKKKLDDIQKTNPQVVTTPCPLCATHIGNGLNREGIKTESEDFTVFLAKRLYGV